jgi:hypothetical protein
MTDQTVARYDCETLGTYDHYGAMVRDDDYGDYVTYEDYAKVMAELVRLVAELVRLKDELHVRSLFV